MIKRHWPILFAILIIIVSIILGIVASHSTDTGVVIAVGLVILMFLFPLAGAVLGGWYGWNTRKPIKWLLSPAVYLAVCLYLLIADVAVGNGVMEMESYLTVSLFSGIACLAAEAIASLIAWLVSRNKAK